MNPSGWQIREGRRIAGLSQDALSKAAGVGLAMVAHAELLDRPLIATQSTTAIKDALEGRGIRFVRDADGLGVQRQ